MIIMQSIIPNQNRYRLYCIDSQPDLFGGFYVATTWSRIDGSRRQGKTYWFANEQEAQKKIRSLWEIRLRHNYQVWKGCLDKSSIRTEKVRN